MTRYTGRTAWRALTALVLLAVPACGGDPLGEDESAPVTVFAAASLTEVLTELVDVYEATEPGTRVVTSFAGSGSLVAQIQQGAGADLVVTADDQSMAALEPQLVAPPQALARNTLAIVTEPGNPQRIRSLVDLARPGLLVVLAAPSVPAGRAARSVLAEAGVQVRPVSEELDVKAVLSKVRLGEADAGIVYRTDVVAAGNTVAGVPLDGIANRYPAAVLWGAAEAGPAHDLLDFLLSEPAQRIFASYGFRPPA